MEQNNNNDAKQKSPIRRFLLILGVAFICAYFVLGLMIIFKPNLFVQLSKTNKIILGSAMILYGAFRSYRLIKKNAEEYEEE
ncbi:hypothetical protein [Solitalea koreensis]|uniref:Uncharacterized protein n=1 Tax=Solitalea koreensis TaxID=543615 RepID=A0A521C641_9SPHI|nr:hypothetical protein [Solitalea koreensis]SMO54902.1 hypothetical protein SAMN06265350_103252 [Solitalea koreensis]